MQAVDYQRFSFSDCRRWAWVAQATRLSRSATRRPERATISSTQANQPFMSQPWLKLGTAPQSLATFWGRPYRLHPLASRRRNLPSKPDHLLGEAGRLSPISVSISTLRVPDGTLRVTLRVRHQKSPLFMRYLTALRVQTPGRTYHTGAGRSCGLDKPQTQPALPCPPAQNRVSNCNALTRFSMAARLARAVAVRPKPSQQNDATALP